MENSKKGSIRCIESIIGRRLRCYCRTCKKPFLCKFKEFIRGGGLYCSVICYRNTPKPVKRSRPRSWLNRCCRGCGKEFKAMICIVKKGGGVYCTRKCAFKYFRRKNKIIEKKCIWCDKIFVVERSDRNDNLYCSRKCCYEDPSHRPNMSHPCTEEQKHILSEFMKKRFEKEDVWNKGKKTPQTGHKGKTHWNYGHRGPESPSWKGANRPLYRQIRTCPEYVNWHNDVLEKGLHVCKACGYYTELTVHHIKPFSKIIKDNNIMTIDDAKLCKELWDVDNGIVLCVLCHHVWDKNFNRKPSQTRINYYNPLFN